MSEEGSMYEGDFGPVAAEKNERRELFGEGQRKPQTEEEWILFDLAGRYDVDKAPPVSFLEAKTLIKAVEKDGDERGMEDRDVLESPESLELIQSALAKASEGTEEFTRGELRDARAYFTWKKEQWTNSNRDFPPEYAEKLRRVYGDVLRQLNEKMPVPESILPFLPSEPGFQSTQTILKPLVEGDQAKGDAHVKEHVGKQDVVACFEAMNTDIGNQRQPLGIMENAVSTARSFFETEGIEPDNRVCVVIISADGQTVTIEPYQEEKTYSKLTSDGKRQFILDMTVQQRYNNDGLFVHEVGFYDNLKASADRTTSAIQRLFDNPSTFEKKDIIDVTIGLARLEKLVDPKDQLQTAAVQKLIETIKKKLVDEGFIAVASDDDEDYDEDEDDVN